ncbi:UNC-like C-terminal-domain-containing protein [Neocallimastix sp. 'constans']
MFENNRKRSSLKPGQLNEFNLNNNENYLDQSSNKENIYNGKNINRKLNTNDQLIGNAFNQSNKKINKNYHEETIENFTSPEPYNFYLHNSDSDLVNPSAQAYNRAGSKNYFISETPTPFFYDDIMNKGRLTDTTKKNKPSTINNNSYHTQNQKFYSNSYGLDLDKDDQDDDNSINDTNTNKQDYIPSIWSVSPPFSATKTEDTNLDAVIEEDNEIEDNYNQQADNSLYNSSSFAIHHDNDIPELDQSNINLYDQEEPIIYNNDYPPEESINFNESHNYQNDKPNDTNLQNKFCLSSQSSTIKNPSIRNSEPLINSNASIKSLPNEKSSSFINQLNESHSKSNFSILSHSRSLTSPTLSSSSTKPNVLKNRINKGKSSFNNNTNTTSKKNDVLANSSISSIDSPSFSSLTFKDKPKNPSIRKSIIGNYYSLMKKNKIGNAHKRLNSFKFNKEKQKPIFNSNDNQEFLADEDFYMDSDSNQEELLNKEYRNKTSYKIIEYDSQHQKILYIEDQLIKLETMLAKLNQETENIKSDAPQAYLDQFNKEIEHLSVRLANVAEEASQSSLINSKQKQDIQNLKHLSSNIEVNFNDLKTNVEDFNQILQQVETKIDMDKDQQINKLKKSLEPLLKKTIPNIMIAKINPVTQSIEFDERFWRYLSKNFLTIDSLKTLIKSHDDALEEMNRRSKLNIPTWDDFIESNRQMLENYISNEFQEQLHQGDIIISKDDVIALVQSEFHHYLSNLNTSIPELHDAIKGYIEQALEKYSIDINTKPDYALESSGAQIISSFTSESYHRYPDGTLAKAWANIFGISGVLLGKSPLVALQPDTHAGNCWAMNGNHGYLTIQLSKPIIPSHITIEHMSQEESVPDSLLNSAPKEIEVYGITNPVAIEKMTSNNHGQSLSLSSSPYAIHLTSIVFDPRDNFIITEPVSNEAKIKLQSSTPIQIIQFQIISNWGEPRYTCIYRVRVHGHESLMKDIKYYKN